VCPYGTRHPLAATHSQTMDQSGIEVGERAAQLKELRRLRKAGLRSDPPTAPDSTQHPIQQHGQAVLTRIMFDLAPSPARDKNLDDA
jgi:hypothetical protein